MKASDFWPAGFRVGLHYRWAPEEDGAPSGCLLIRPSIIKLGLTNEEPSFEMSFEIANLNFANRDF